MLVEVGSAVYFLLPSPACLHNDTWSSHQTLNKNYRLPTVRSISPSHEELGFLVASSSFRSFEKTNTFLFFPFPPLLVQRRSLVKSLVQLGGVSHVAPGRPFRPGACCAVCSPGPCERQLGAKLLLAHLQLRRLPHRHRQLCPPDGEEPQPLRCAAVREDVLWPPHRPGERRPPRHRLRRARVWDAQCHGHSGGNGPGGLPARRQLRHHLGHREQRVLLRQQGAGHHPLLARHADVMVQGPPETARATEHRQQRPKRRARVHGRDRRERLQLRVREGHAARQGARLRPRGGREARRDHRGADRDGRQGVRGAREPALRVRAVVPAAVPERRRQGLRGADGVPRLVQQVRPVPQPGAHRASRRAPAAAPGRHHRLRRLVRRHDEHLPVPREARIHKRFALLLREPDRDVRRTGVHRLRRPIYVRLVGRDASDGGSVQGDRRRRDSRAARVPCSSGQDLPIELRKPAAWFADS